MAAPNMDHFRLGLTWGTPHPDGYHSYQHPPTGVVTVISRTFQGRYKEHGYVYLKFSPTSPHGVVSFGLSDEDDPEWANVCREGELEVVMLETEDATGRIFRLERGKADTMRITAASTGTIDAGIWRLVWRRDESGKLISLVSNADSRMFLRMG